MAIIELGDQTLNLVTLDFETYYAPDYSLRSKHHNMSSYIRDPQFKAHGVGIIDGGRYTWITGDIASQLAQFDWENIAMIGHNTLFDCYILAYHYGIYPKFIIDTQAMSRLYYGAGYRHSLDALSLRVGGKGKVLANNLVNTKGIRDLDSDLLAALGKYCKDDCTETYEAFTYLYPFVPDSELRLIDLTTRLFTKSPLKVNLALATEELEYEQSKKRNLVAIAGVEASQLSSNQQFAELLARADINVPTKVSPRTGETTYAFAKNDAGFQMLLESDDPVAVSLCEARLAVKSSINETRAQRLIDAGTNGQRLPVGLNHAAAKTHRWGGTNKLNLQNLQRQGYLPTGGMDLNTGRLRRSIEVDDGYVLVVNDSSQIEVRVSAWWAKQNDLLEDFRNRVAIYEKMAARVFTKDISQVTKAERFIGKCLILGLGYGMGASKLGLTLELGLLGGGKVLITPGEAQRYVDTYRNTFPFIVNGWNICNGMISAMIHGGTVTHNGVTATKNMLTFPNGTRIYYRNIGYDKNGDCQYQTRAGFARIYGAILYENIIQKLARDIIAEQLLVVDKLENVQVVTTTHDEITVMTTEDNAQHTLNALQRIMDTPPSWCSNIPLASEGDWAQNYSK